MLKSEKKAIRNTKLRYMAITSSIFLLILSLAIVMLNVYYEERRRIGGAIEIQQKVPILVEHNFDDSSLVGYQTQERMFIITFTDGDNYEVHWGENTYHDFIKENIKSIHDEKTFIGDFLISTVTINNVVYYCGFDQEPTISQDNAALQGYTTLMVSSYLVIVVTLYFTSYIMLKPMKDNLKIQSDFIANSSHNLKTPISIIKSNAELMKEKYGESKELDLINEESDYMNLLIDDLLMLDNMSNTKTRQTEEVNLSEFVKAAVLTFDALAYERNISFECDIQENIFYKINQKDFKTLINQLVNNAFKYIGNERKVKLGFMSIENNYVLSVYNTGCQVKESDKDRLFERFYRDQSALNSHSEKGSGIGLAIVKAICECYGYKIDVDLVTGEYFNIKICLPKIAKK